LSTLRRPPVKPRGEHVRSSGISILRACGKQPKFWSGCGAGAPVRGKLTSLGEGREVRQASGTLDTLRLPAGDRSQERRVSTRYAVAMELWDEVGLVRVGGRRACRRGRSPGLERIARLAGFARSLPPDAG